MLLQPVLRRLLGDVNVRCFILADKADFCVTDPGPDVCSQLVVFIPSCHLLQEGVERLPFCTVCACCSEHWYTLQGLLIEPVSMHKAEARTQGAANVMQCGQMVPCNNATGQLMHDTEGKTQAKFIKFSGTLTEALAAIRPSDDRLQLIMTGCLHNSCIRCSSAPVSKAAVYECVNGLLQALKGSIKLPLLHHGLEVIHRAQG